MYILTTSLIGKQINYVATQLCRAIAILNKVKHKLDIKTLILLYNSLFYSHLNYCVHIWGHTFVYSLLKIIIIQKRALKCILGTQYNSYNYNKLHSTFNILKFSDIVKYNTAKFMNRANNKMLPINLQKLYKIKTYNKIYFIE